MIDTKPSLVSTRRPFGVAVASFLFLILFFFSNLSLLAAQNLALIDDGDLQIRLEEQTGNPGAFQVSINDSRGLVSEPVVFALDNPPRLVVDVPDARGRAAQKQMVSSRSISAIRTGLHKDKIRIVIDLNNSNGVTHATRRSPDGQTATVAFSFDGTTPTPQATSFSSRNEPAATADDGFDVVEMGTPPAPKKSALAVEPGWREIKPRNEVAPPRTASSIDSASSKLPLPNPGIERDRGETTSKLAVINGIYYKTLLGNATSAIMVDTKGLSNYSLNRRDPTMWELTLERSKLGGAHLSLPQFPPDSFEGFEVIVARQRVNDVVVKIYVEEDKKLSPFRARGKLWVKIEQ